MNTNSVFLGDIVPGGLLALDLQKKALGEDVLKILDSADFVVGNLESPFGKAQWQVQGKPIIFSRPEDAVRLKELSLSVVSLANNHIFDLGLQGFQKTIEILDEMGIQHCGAGMNESEARKPVFVEKGGLKIGFLAYADELRGMMMACEDKPGVALLDEENMLEDIVAAKGNCDHLFMLLHWGKEYTWLPNSNSTKLVKRLIKAGVAGVIGGHSHRLQSFGKYKGKPYFYSLGNFLFPDYLLGPPGAMYYPDNPEDVAIDSLPIKTSIKPVNEIHLRIWRKYSRIGLMGKVRIEKQTFQSEAILTFSSRQDSRLSLLPRKREKRIRIWLTALTLIVQSPFYPLVYGAYLGFVKAYLFLKDGIK